MNALVAHGVVVTRRSQSFLAFEATRAVSMLGARCAVHPAMSVFEEG